MPLSRLHRGNDIYKWRSASHRCGVTGSRSTTACGRDGNNTEVSRVPRLSSEHRPVPVAFDCPRQGFDRRARGRGRVSWWEGWGKRRAGWCHRPGKLLRSAWPQRDPLGGTPQEPNAPGLVLLLLLLRGTSTSLRARSRVCLIVWLRASACI